MSGDITGRMLAHYRVESALGAGGMGTVYRAYDTRLRRPVAIKLLTSAGADDPAHRVVLREARAASRLNHPNICAVHEVGEADGRPFIVMEFVDGRTLAEVVPPDGLPVQTVLQLGVQIAGALAHAHGQGLLHRDLKAQNVAVTPEGRVKVLDFGVAVELPRAAATDDTTLETRTGDAVFAGTPAYMAPEALRGEPAREPADIWAIGVVLYEMATGHRPFRGGSSAELISAILRDPAIPPATVHGGLRRIILRCLQKDPSQRYASAVEVRTALETLTETLEHGAEGTAPATARPRFRPSGRAFGAGAGILAAMGAALWWALSPEGAVGPANFRLLSTFPGAHRAATLSPDGRQMAFVDVSQPVPHVWVTNLTEGNPIQITSGEVPAERPRWSPVNDRIVFARRGAGIWEVSSLGGAERQLVASGANPHLSADGRLLAFERDAEIWIAAPDGSDQRRVDGVPPRNYTVPLAPALSPDGRLIAMFVSELGPNGDFWVIPSSGGEARRLTYDVTEGGTPDWTPDGRQIVFSSARGGSHTLWMVSPEGGEPVPLTTGAGEDRDPAFSADGRRLVYTNVRNRWSLMLKEMASGAERRLIENRSGVLWPMISPDGSRVAYFGPDGRGSVHVFTVEVESGDVRQITRSPAGVREINTMPRWGADADHLYYYRQRPDDSFRRIPVVGGPSEEVAPWRWEERFGAAVHPVDERVAYLLRRPGQPAVARIFDPADGTEADVSRPLVDMSWSADGRYLLGSWANQIYRCEADGLRACHPVAAGSKPYLTEDGARLLLFRPGPSPLHREIWVRDLASGVEQEVRTIGPLRFIDLHFHVSNDGAVVWAPFEEGRHELWMAEIR